MNLVECIDDQTLEQITPEIMDEFPNTYTLTKCLAEDVVRTRCAGMPVAVFRPAIVIPTIKEPVVGWIDNHFGPTGIIVGVGAGLLRTIYVDERIPAEIVPVDMCVNALLASAWDLSRNGRSEIPVYNYVTSPENPITWRMYCDFGIEVRYLLKKSFAERVLMLNLFFITLAWK